MINTPKTTYVKDKTQVVPANTFDKADVLRKSYTYFNGVENRFGFSWKRFSSGAAGAVQGFQLRNGSNNLIAVIERFTIFQSIAGGPIVYFGPQTTDLTFPLVPVRLDARIVGSTSGLNPSLASGGFAIPNTMFGIANLANCPANFLYDLVTTVNNEIALLPGDAILLSTVAAQNPFCVCHWRERLLEESEKSGNYGRLL